jgi:rhodanese-related sulfurtransferase
MKRLLLVAAFAIVALAQTRKITDSDELAKLLKDEKNMFFLDVREPKEIEELGSLKGYVNIPLGELEKRMNEVPKDKTIITA